MDRPTRDMLICFATSIFGHRPVPEGVDWDALHPVAVKHGLIPLAHHFISCADGGLVPSEFKSLLRTYYLASAARTIQLTGQLRNILRTLKDAGVSLIVLKGPALAETIYPEPALRPFADLDLLCREGDWLIVHKTLLNLGYVSLSEAEVDQPPPKIWQHKAYWHNQYYNYAVGVHVEIHFDLWQTDLRPRLGNLIWERAATVQIARVETRALSLEDQILHLCVHLHHHSYARLIWFTDLALILIRHEKGIDWRYLTEAARAEGVTLAVYYCLKFLQPLMGVQAPSEVLHGLRPGPFKAVVHNRLWPPDRVLQLEVQERIEFQLREVPVANELLLNLLLTGRVRDNLMYLLRLLFPPGQWLARYYGTNDHRTLRRRRVVHAPKTMLMALGGLGGLLRRFARSLVGGAVDDGGIRPGA